MVMRNSSSASVSFSIFISADVFTGSTICAAAVIASISNHTTTVPVFMLCFILLSLFILISKAKLLIFLLTSKHFTKKREKG